MNLADGFQGSKSPDKTTDGLLQTIAMLQGQVMPIEHFSGVLISR